MKLLIIGGGVFLGKAVAGAAIRRGHQVTIFNRGKATTEVLPGVEWIKGDRNEDLHALSHREWDAAIDTCGYFPRQVRVLLQAIGAKIGHYAFISSVSAYADLSHPGVTENSRLAALLNPNEDKVTGDTYGPLKGACEEAALQSGIHPVLLQAKSNSFSRSGERPRGLSSERRECLTQSGPHVRDLAAWLLTEHASNFGLEIICFRKDRLGYAVRSNASLNLS